MTLSCCWTILFLTTFPALVFGGRRDPAAGKSSSHSLILHPHGHAELNPGFMQFRFSGRSDLMNSCRAYVVRKLKFTKVDRPPLSPHLNGIRGHDTFRVWKDKKLLQPSYSHEQQQHSHRLLIGSSPPTCRGKCGLCQPCKPVHVIIAAPRVTITEQEYYPEVWRCQCGNMLYMP
ncbi:unnamed protein product [Sphagnum compactum]